MATATERLRALNDQLRSSFVGGAVTITKGVESIPFAKRRRILDQVRGFDAFDADNDPHGEHDCALLEAEGERILFKIDYYDRSMRVHSPDPTDPAVTARILTIMLASEYLTQRQERCKLNQSQQLQPRPRSSQQSSGRACMTCLLPRL